MTWKADGPEDKDTGWSVIDETGKVIASHLSRRTAQLLAAAPDLEAIAHEAVNWTLDSAEFEENQGFHAAAQAERQVARKWWAVLEKTRGRP